MIYLASLPNTVPSDELYPKSRDEEVRACGGEKTRREKYFVWKLLEQAVNDTFQKSLDEFTFSRSKNGKWKCDGFAFSLAHSDGLLCVALSQEEVGVDVQRVRPPKTETVAKKILSPRELIEYAALPKKEKADYFTRKWTERESTFKRLDLPAFFPALPLLFQSQTHTEILEINKKRYTVSVSTESKTIPKIRILH